MSDKKIPRKDAGIRLPFLPSTQKTEGPREGQKAGAPTDQVEKAPTSNIFETGLARSLLETHQAQDPGQAHPNQPVDETLQRALRGQMAAQQRPAPAAGATGPLAQTDAAFLAQGGNMGPGKDQPRTVTPGQQQKVRYEHQDALFEATNKGLSRVRGMNVWQDIGGNLFGPAQLRPTQGGPASLLHREELTRAGLNPSALKQRARDKARSMRETAETVGQNSTRDNLKMLFSSKLMSQVPELFHAGMEKVEQKLGYQHSVGTGQRSFAIGPQAQATTQHKVGDLGSATHTVEGRLGVEGDAQAGVQWGRAGGRAAGEASFRAGPMAQHRTDVDLGSLGKGGMTNTLRADAQGHASGSLKAGVAGLRGTGGAGFRVGPALESSGTWKHDLVELGYGGRAAVEAKADAKADVSLDARGLQVAMDAGGSVGGEIAGAAQMKTDLFQAGVAGKAEARLHADGYVDGALDVTGLNVSAGGNIGATAAVEGRIGAKTTDLTLGGEKLNLNGTIRGRLEATAQAGARADAQLTVYPPQAGADIGAKAFAGVKAEAEAKVGVSDMFSITGRGGAWAGAGADAGVKLGFSDGKFKLGFNAGAAVGYGVGGGVMLEVDALKIARTAIGTGVDAIEKSFTYAQDPRAAVKDAKELIEKIPNKIEKTVESVEKTAKTVAKQAKKGIKSLVKSLFG